MIVSIISRIDIYKKLILFYSRKVNIHLLEYWIMDFENIHDSWKPFFIKWQKELTTILDEVYSGKSSSSKTYPDKKLIFKAFEIDVTRIELVIVGQDCYHGEGQAMGLCFSVPSDIKIPPSLVNIFKEIKNEFPERNYSFTHGDLTKWAVKSNIFLLNSALTVKQATPLSHIKIWEPFTNAVIKYVLDYNSRCVFLLLGNYAKDKCKIINSDIRCVKGVHPSPLSAHNGFFNSGMFKNIEDKLLCKIDWQN
jgi:uracil-DNA glycosylase